MRLFDALDARGDGFISISAFVDRIFPTAERGSRNGADFTRRRVARKESDEDEYRPRRQSAVSESASRRAGRAESKSAAWRKSKSATIFFRSRRDVLNEIKNGMLDINENVKKAIDRIHKEFVKSDADRTGRLPKGKFFRYVLALSAAVKGMLF
jgi:hypothetical protein